MSLQALASGIGSAIFRRRGSTTSSTASIAGSDPMSLAETVMASAVAATSDASASVSDPTATAAVVVPTAEELTDDEIEYDEEGQEINEGEEGPPPGGWYNGFSEDEVVIPGAPVKYNSGEDVYIQSGKWAFFKGGQINEIRTQGTVGAGSMCVAYYAIGKVKGREVPFICKRWDIWRRWIGFWAELYLFSSSTHLRLLQGVCVPSIISLQHMPGGYVGLNMALPDPDGWIEAHPKYTSRADKKKIIEAYELIHANGVLHGDVELRHMLIGNSGNICIIDFSLARAMQSKREVNLKACSQEDLDWEMRRVKYLLDWEGAEHKEHVEWADFGMKKLEFNNELRKLRKDGYIHSIGRLSDEQWDVEEQRWKMADPRYWWFGPEYQPTSEKPPRSHTFPYEAEVGKLYDYHRYDPVRHYKHELERILKYAEQPMPNYIAPEPEIEPTAVSLGAPTPRLDDPSPSARKPTDHHSRKIARAKQAGIPLTRLGVLPLVSTLRSIVPRDTTPRERVVQHSPPSAPPGVDEVQLDEVQLAEANGIHPKDFAYTEQGLAETRTARSTYESLATDWLALMEDKMAERERRKKRMAATRRGILSAAQVNSDSTTGRSAQHTPGTSTTATQLVDPNPLNIRDPLPALREELRMLDKDLADQRGMTQAHISILGMIRQERTLLEQEAWAIAKDRGAQWVNGKLVVSEEAGLSEQMKAFLAEPGSRGVFDEIPSTDSAGPSTSAAVPQANTSVSAATPAPTPVPTREEDADNAELPKTDEIVSSASHSSSLTDNEPTSSTSSKSVRALGTNSQLRPQTISQRPHRSRSSALIARVGDRLNPGLMLPPQSVPGVSEGMAKTNIKEGKKKTKEDIASITIEMGVTPPQNPELPTSGGRSLQRQHAFKNIDTLEHVQPVTQPEIPTSAPGPSVSDSVGPATTSASREAAQRAFLDVYSAEQQRTHARFPGLSLGTRSSKKRSAPDTEEGTETGGSPPKKQRDRAKK